MWFQLFSGPQGIFKSLSSLLELVDYLISVRNRKGTIPHLCKTCSTFKELIKCSAEGIHLCWGSYCTDGESLASTAALLTAKL